MARLVPDHYPRRALGRARACVRVERAEVKRGQLFWRIHTPNLLQEIVKGSGQDIYRIPCSMLGLGLAAIAKRASQLNDPKLNALMCRLTLYEISDPDSPGYNKALAEKIMR